MTQTLPMWGVEAMVARPRVARARATAGGGGAYRRLRRLLRGAAAALPVAVGSSAWVGVRILTVPPRQTTPRPWLKARFFAPVGERPYVQLLGRGADAPGRWGLIVDDAFVQVDEPIGEVTDETLPGAVARPYRVLAGTPPTAAAQAERRREERRGQDRREERRGQDRREERREADHRDERRRSDRRHRAVAPPWPVDATLSSYAWPDDPQALAADVGARWQIDPVPSGEGTLPAWRFTPRRDLRAPAGGRPAGETWLIGVHGRGARRSELFRVVSIALSGGLTCLVTSYRTDPWTARPARRSTLGATEWEDIEAAVRVALDAGARRVVLAGCSLGGAITATFLRRSALADRVAGVILDAPALNWGPILRHIARIQRVPSPLVPLVMAAARLRTRIDFRALDHVGSAAEFSHPILLVHGTEDPVVPVRLSDTFAAARTDLVTYLRVDGAGHVTAWNTAPERYTAAVGGFLAAVSGAPAASAPARPAPTGSAAVARPA